MILAATGFCRSCRFKHVTDPSGKIIISASTPMAIAKATNTLETRN
jgi:hypothetical protein